MKTSADGLARQRRRRQPGPVLSRRQASPPPRSLGADSRVTNAKSSPGRARPASPAHSHTKGSPVQVEGQSLCF